MWSGFHETSSLAPDLEKWSEWVEVTVVNFLASKMAECLVLWDQLSWRCRCLVSGIRGGGWVTVWVLEVCFGITFGSVVNDLGQLVFPYVLKLPSVCVCVCLHVCLCMRACTPVLSHVWLFVTAWTVACQASLSMEFSRQEYWSGLPFPTPGDINSLIITL